jgi:hypothetical protein
MLARQRGGVTPIDSHPISAIWVRYRGVKDLDGLDVAGPDPADGFARAVLASRRLATNHFTGWGYWIWFIPLKDGETSVGLVWDKRLVQPEGRTPLEKLQRFLDDNPLTRELLERATPVEGDCRSYGHLPYFVDRFIGPGWACVGDAGGFLDPFYSPGLDQMAFSVHTRVGLIAKALSGADPQEMRKEYEAHNTRYARFFRYFYESIYRDKYHVMGDYDTMTTAFLLDTGLYYAAAILPVYRWSHDRLGFPPFYQDGAEIGYYPIRFYNRRLTAIAKRKKALGIYGNHNGGWSCLDLKTGQVRWNDRGVGKGSLCYADGMLYLFSERGGVVGLGTAKPEGLQLTGQFQVAGTGESWAYPVVIGGRLYLRYSDNLYCFNVKAQ